jgi:hypothetical protein
MITSALAAGLIAVIGFANAAPTPSTSADVPARADNFQLTDNNLIAQELHYYRSAPAIVLMTQINGSTLSRQGAAELEKLQADFKAKGVLFYMLNSNLSDKRDAVIAEAKKQGYDIPVLLDERQLVGESLGVTREAEVFVIDPKSSFKIAYHGPLDDRFASAKPDVNKAAKASYARDAISSVLSGAAVEKARVDVKAGKTIAFPLREKMSDFSKISYSKEIAPIIQSKCVTCHQQGGIAPFAFNSYDVVKGFAPMIRETLRTGRMPPYFADPHIGKFKNDQSISADEMKTLVHWIEAGAPRGDGGDILKEQASVAPEWPVELGKPDIIVDLPAFDVPASGIVEYQNQKVDNPFKEDAWLRAIAIKPGNLAVLHHVVSNHVPDPKLPRSKVPGGSVGSYTPGAQPQIIADNAGAPVPAGGKLNFQMHYTTTGKPETDHTKVGFYVLKTPPKYIKRSTVIGDFGLVVPAGESRYKEVAYQTFPADAYIYTLYPHAHYRGFHVELKAQTPDGKETMLINLPKYDFNWQRDYDPVEPILIKAGTKLIATWVYDNSSANKALHAEAKDAAGSPIASYSVPAMTGEQTYQEMMYFRVNYRWADETTDNVRNDLQMKLMQSMVIGMADDNTDDAVEPGELKGMLASLKPRFKQLDTDGNGTLNAAELTAATAPLMKMMMADIPDL